MVVSKCVRMRVGWCALMGMAGIPAVSSNAAIQYDVVSLSRGLIAYGVDHGHVVGMGYDGSGAEAAALWNAPGKAPTFLTHGGPAAYAISGSQVVGQYYAGANAHAGLWVSGTAVDLNPPNGEPSAALATDGTYQGGYVDFGAGTQAALWNGTPASFVSLSDWYNSAVTGISGGVQVGYGNGDALVWHGTAASQAILGSGRALRISHGQIVGSATINNQQHAAIWTGQTAASFVDLGSTLHNTQLNATNGTQQVGYVTDSQYVPPVGDPMDKHPVVWHGTASSAQALPPPAGYVFGEALGIDQDGNIVGYAVQFGPTLPPRQAVLWVPHRVPGDANFDGRVDFSDLVTVARNYGQVGSQLGWVDGDFNGDGSVGFDDLMMVARNYGSGAPTTSQLAQLEPSFRTEVERAFADIPEPSATGLVAACIGVLMLRRNRGAAGHAPSGMSDRP